MDSIAMTVARTKLFRKGFYEVRADIASGSKLFSKGFYKFQSRGLWISIGFL